MAQLNGVFTLYSCMCAMMEKLGLHENLKTGLLYKWEETATKLEKSGQPAGRIMCAQEILR